MLTEEINNSCIIQGDPSGRSQTPVETKAKVAVQSKKHILNNSFHFEVNRRSPCIFNVISNKKSPNLDSYMMHEMYYTNFNLPLKDICIPSPGTVMITLCPPRRSYGSRTLLEARRRRRDKRPKVKTQ